MSRCNRHRDWQLPATVIGGPSATINIVPAPNATYIPSDWKFELDSDAVFKRLIDDVYVDPLSFVRELIQNALDATRCQLYLALKKDGLEVPEYPTQVEKARRYRYAVRVGIRAEEMRNPLSGEMERRHIVSVTDQGIGMDREIIHRYLLQVGRSYYSTSEFQRNFRFIPTSRFGLGFLSVFAVSDRVIVETYKPTSSDADGALRLVLTGPRNYLLLEKEHSRTVAGTKIEVLLREPLPQGRLTQAVTHWCRKVEFPVAINDLGAETVVNPESPEQFTYEIPDVTEPGARLVVRTFDVNRHGIEGELYVFGRVNSRGESWAAWDWANYSYPSMHPQASAPRFPNGLSCLHGITIGESKSYEFCERIDYRDGSVLPVLSRDVGRYGRTRREEADVRIVSSWEELLREHLATSEHAREAGGWDYKQRLIKKFRFPAFWAAIPGTIPICVVGQSRLVSLDDFVVNELIATVIAPMEQRRFHTPRVDTVMVVGSSIIGKIGKIADCGWDYDTPCIAADNIERLSSLHRGAIFDNRSVDSVRWLSNGCLAVYWRIGAPDVRWISRHLVALPDEAVVAVEIHKTDDDIYRSVLFNCENVLVKWLLAIERGCSTGECGLSPDQSTRLWSMLLSATRYPGGSEMEKFSGYFKGWNSLSGLTAELRPPEIEISSDMFYLRCPTYGEQARDPEVPGSGIS